MKRCSYTPKERDELIILDVTGEIAPHTASDFRRHLAGCDICQKRFDELSNFAKAIAYYAHPEPLTNSEIARLNHAIMSRKTSALKSKSLFSRLAFLQLPSFGYNFSRAFLKPVALAFCFLILIFSGWHLYHKPALSLHTAKINQMTGDEADIIANLDMLEDLDALEKLVKVLDESAENRS